MKLLIVALAVVLVAEIVSVQAQEEEEEGYDELPGGWDEYHGGARWAGRWDADRYKLSVTVSNENVEEYVLVRNFWKSVLVRSRDGDYLSSKIGRSFSVYDLSCDNGIIVIKKIGYPCIVVNTTWTWEKVKEFLKANEDCPVEAAAKVSLDARGPALNSEEIKNMDQSYRSVLHFCPSRQIVLATPVDSAQPFPDNSTDVINIVSLNTPYSIRVL